MCTGTRSRPYSNWETQLRASCASPVQVAVILKRTSAPCKASPDSILTSQPCFRSDFTISLSVANVFPSLWNFNIFLLLKNSPCPYRSQLHHFPSFPHFTMLLLFRNQHALSVPKVLPSVPNFFPSGSNFSNVIRTHSFPNFTNCRPLQTSPFSFRSKLRSSHTVLYFTTFLPFQTSPFSVRSGLHFSSKHCSFRLKLHCVPSVPSFTNFIPLQLHHSPSIPRINMLLPFRIHHNNLSVANFFPCFPNFTLRIFIMRTPIRQL